MTSEFSFFFKVQLRSLDQKAPPTRSTDSPPSPPVSTVKACDTQALLLIPLISTASASSSSSALCASCSAFQTTGGFTCQLLVNLKTKGLLSPCGHRRKSLFNCAVWLEPGDTDAQGFVHPLKNNISQSGSDPAPRRTRIQMTESNPEQLGNIWWWWCLNSSRWRWNVAINGAVLHSNQILGILKNWFNIRAIYFSIFNFKSWRIIIRAITSTTTRGP